MADFPYMLKAAASPPRPAARGSLRSRLASLAVLASQHHDPDQESEQLVAPIGDGLAQIAPPVASAKATADAAS